MALDPGTKYGAQVDTATDTTGYPWGQARNISVAGDGTGTPLEKAWVSDIWGFFQAVLSGSSQTPTNTPDKVGASQILTGIRRIISFDSTRRILSSWYTAQTLSASVNGMVYDDTNLVWVALSLGSANSYAKWSPDGANWTAGTIAGLGYAPSAVRMAAGGGTIIATWNPTSSTATRLMRSTDGGATWATQDLPVAADLNSSIVWTGTNFLLIQSDGVVYKSTSGATGTWTAVTSLPAGYNDTHFIRWGTDGSNVLVGTAIGADTKVIVTDDEGSTWSTTDVTGASGPMADGVVYSERHGKWFIVGEDDNAPAAWSATDPTGTWTQLTVTVTSNSTTDKLDTLQYLGGILVAMRGVEVVTSSDGGESWKGGLRIFTTDNGASAGGRAMHWDGSSYYMTPAVDEIE